MYCLVLLHQMHIFGIEITFSEIKNKPAFLKQVNKNINVYNEYKTLNNFAFLRKLLLLAILFCKNTIMILII